MTSAYDGAGVPPSDPQDDAEAAGPEPAARTTPSEPTVLQRAKALWCQLVSGLG